VTAVTDHGLDARGRPPAVNAALAALADVVGKVSTLAWTVVAARLLTQEQFGAFNLALALALIASAVAEGGYDPVLVRTSTPSTTCSCRSGARRR
jgi:O-antigen/teichoic acid export membrane protein